MTKKWEDIVEIIAEIMVEPIMTLSLRRYLMMFDMIGLQIENTYPNIRETPELISLLLTDRTTGRNIRWATESYIEEGVAYMPEKPVRLNHVTNGKNSVIKSRVTKTLEEQKSRTKVSAEVFTPMWVVKKQNDLIEEEFKDLDLEEYIDKTWLEITCGEAPYMCSRYDMVSGGKVELEDRVGFVDRKLQRISREVNGYREWMRLVVKAYKASFGYEFQGDSLLIARENMLYTFIDYYMDKFGQVPLLEDMEVIAEIISYNVFQMDGLKYTVPFTDGIDAEIMDWESNELIEFKSLLEDDKDE